MEKLSTTTFVSKSGVAYEFDVYPWGTRFEQGAAVYVITRRYGTPEGGYSYDVVCIGETDDLSARSYTHRETACFRRHGVNSICIHLEEDRHTRLQIETGLIVRYDPPCND